MAGVDKVGFRTLALTTSTHVLIDAYAIGIGVVLALKFERVESFGRLGLLLGAFTLATALGEPLWGRLSDRTGRRGPIIGWGLVLAGVGFAGIGWVDPEGGGAFPLLLAATFLTGAGVATYHSVATSLVNEVSAREHRGVIQGINNAGGSLGRAVAPFLLAWLCGASGSLLVAALPFGMAGLAFGVFAAFHLKSPPPSRGAPPESPPISTARLLKSRFVLTLAALSFLRSAFFITAVGFLPAFLVGVRGFPGTRMGFVMTLVLAGGIVAQPLGGKLSDHANRARLTGGLLLSSSACFALFLLVRSQVLSVSLLAMSMFLVLMTFPLLFALVGDAVPRDRLGVITGVISGAGGLAATVAQVAAGSLATIFPPAHVLLGLSVLAASSGLLSLTLQRGDGASG